eukprot:PITA_20147
MGCITNINFVVLINGAASHFFKSQRGLRQGCPLSPLLFLLAAEGLSRLILKAKQSGMLTGLEVAVNLFISHLLFVDDILLFLNGNLPEVKVLKDIINLFLKAIGLQINPRKSHFILEGFTRHEALAITSIFPFETTQMDMPFKYLGFWLKPSSYRKQDWHWLVAKIEQRISHWSFKWLSRAGRLTLVNSVLQAIPVFWAALTWIPRGIIHKIKQICSRFLWVVKRKYIDPTPIENWIRSPNKIGRNCSVIWKATLDAFKIIERGLAWKVGNGECVRIGKDPWVGCNEHFALSPELLEQLDSKGIKMLHQIENPGLSSIWAQGWKSAELLDLDVHWRDEWNVFIQELNRSNVRLKDAPDSLVWAHAETGRYSPKAGYDFLMSRKGWAAPVWWAKPLFKLKCPKKARIFFWCALKNKIPTWDILQARFQLGPSRCPLCNDASESISHLFVSCHFTKSVWEESFKLLKCSGKWEGENLSNAWEYWWAHYPEKNMRNLPPIISWGIWISRNGCIFKGKSTPVNVIAVQVSAIFSCLPEPESSSSSTQRADPVIREGIPYAFFDGAAQNNVTGAGIIIHLNPLHSLKASVGLGSGSNNFAELSALKLLLCWLIHRNTLIVQIFGDSANVVNWVNGKFICRNYMLLPLLEEVQSLKAHFNIFSIAHIFREKNEEADRLSKAGLQQVLGSWQIAEQAQDLIHESDAPPFV